ncbi:TrkH potassium transport family, partial [Rhizoctonia solani]
MPRKHVKSRFVTRLSIWAGKHLNFYRVHLLSFTFIPVISAAIFYASNGSTKISYLDSLFMCASAMTTSGLNTVNLSTTTVWQQVILAFLMFIGNSTSISLVVLFVRRSYFKAKCEAAVRMARQQRHERELIRRAIAGSQGTGHGVFARVRARAQTIFGYQAAPEPRPEAREDGLAEKSALPEQEQHQRIRGRVRGETIVGSLHETIGSDDTHIEDDAGNHLGNSEKFRNEYGKAPTDDNDASSGANNGGKINEHHLENAGRRSGPENSHKHSNDQYHVNSFAPPTFTQTAPTPSSTMTLLPEVSESPADETAPSSLETAPVPASNPASVPIRPKLRPRSLALGHESDRDLRKSRARAGDIEILKGDASENDQESNTLPDNHDHQSLSGSPGEKKLALESVGEESAQDVHTTSPTEMSRHSGSPNGITQFGFTTSTSPKEETFSTSPNEMTEFAHSPPSSPPARKIPGSPNLNGHGILMHSSNYPSRSPNGVHQSLPHIGEPVTRPRQATISSPSTRKTTLSPVVRPVFLHAPHITTGGRRTTFAEQVHPLHPHGPMRERAPSINPELRSARREALRARNGTITSPLPPFANLPPHTEGEQHNVSPLNGHSKLANEYTQGYTHHPLRRPRAQTGTGGFANPIGLVAQWGVDYISGVKNFVDAHEREVVHETEGRERRGSVYQRTDSVGSQGAGLTPPDDDVSLDEDDLEKMGGDEYNALVVLSWIVAGHYFVNHMIAFIILAPYSAKVPLVRDVIEAQNQSSGRTLNTTWFALFSVISAYANAGLTVVDTSLTQMSSAYLMIFVIIWLILVGATAFPLSLRFIVWVGTKIFRNGSTSKGLKFLLRHPRRCFMYLFPSHQSWYLLFTLVVIFILDWAAYLTFNIGMPGIEAIPPGPRVVGGFLQAVGQRAGGFTTINLQAIAPALQFVQVYPIAMAVRTSNVYEDSGVVIYQEELDDEEPTNLPAGRGAGFTAYLGWHVKHQLAQDLFWLLAALTTLCAFERNRILAEETAYFNIFSLFFEIVSAFANVGFSLGVSSQPFSLSGEMRTIPKLVIIGLMIRGRHRGLPMAIDRSVQLPTEYKTTSIMTSPSGVSSRRSTGLPSMTRRATVGTWSRTSIRQRQRAQDPTLDSDSDE